MATINENILAAKRGGKPFVAARYNSWKNKQFMEGVTIHTFPDKNDDSDRYTEGTRLLRGYRDIGRPNWNPSKSPDICSVHLEGNCFIIDKTWQDNFYMQ